MDRTATLNKCCAVCGFKAARLQEQPGLLCRPLPRPTRIRWHSLLHTSAVRDTRTHARMQRVTSATRGGGGGAGGGCSPRNFCETGGVENLGGRGGVGWGKVLPRSLRIGRLQPVGSAHT